MTKEPIPNDIRYHVTVEAYKQNLDLNSLPVDLRDDIIRLVWIEALCSAIDSDVAKHYTEANLEDVS